jgi:general secretion pathway protein B
MSYILDAIRKSDLQRQRAAAPTLLTAHAEPDAPQPPLPAIYAIGAGALLAAGIAIGWWRPWAAPPTEPPAATPVATGPTPPAVVVVPIPPPRFEHDVVVARPPTVARTTAVPVSAPASPAPQLTPPLATPSQVPAAAPAAVPAPSPVDRATVDASSEAKTLNFAELPPAIQQEIPRMSISVHAYSSQPKNRLVTIDDRMLHEGDSVAPGLRLVQITPDGLIFSFKGYRFRRSVKEIVGNH